MTDATDTEVQKTSLRTETPKARLTRAHLAQDGNYFVLHCAPKEGRVALHVYYCTLDIAADTGRVHSDPDKALLYSSFEDAEADATNAPTISFNHERPEAIAANVEDGCVFPDLGDPGVDDGD